MITNDCRRKLIRLFVVVIFIFLSSYLIVSAVPVIPNAASITGVVSEYGIVSARLLGIQPEQPIYKLTIFLKSSEEIASMPNLLKGKEGQDITFFTKERLSSDIFGKKIKAEASYMGDEHGGRWWIRNIIICQ